MKILRLKSILCKYLFIKALVILSGISLAQSNETLTIGMELAYPPFEMTDKDGNPTGVSVDMAYALGEFLGKDVVIENISWDGLIPALRTSKVDLVISSMTITEQRARVIDFSDPYANSSLALLVNKNSNIESYEDINQSGKKIAVKKGTTGHIFAQQELPNAEVLVFDKESAAELEVAQGKADAFIYDQLSIYRAWKKLDQNTQPLLSPIGDETSWGIAMKKGSELRPEVNKFIAEFKEDGGFDSLAQKYLTDEKAVFDELNIPFFF